jgi:hypothetical protein
VSSIRSSRRASSRSGISGLGPLRALFELLVDAAIVRRFSGEGPPASGDARLALVRVGVPKMEQEPLHARRRSADLGATAAASARSRLAALQRRRVSGPDIGGADGSVIEPAADERQDVIRIAVKDFG